MRDATTCCESYIVNEKNKTPARAHLRSPRNIFPYTTFGPGVVRARGACCADASDRGLLYAAKRFYCVPHWCHLPNMGGGGGWHLLSYITHIYAHVAEIIGGGSRWDLNCECHPSSHATPTPWCIFIHSFCLRIRHCCCVRVHVQTLREPSRRGHVVQEHYACWRKSHNRYFN